MKPFEFSCATDVGSERSSNQDCVAVFPSLGLVLLADGMGGYRGGEVASRYAIKIVQNEVRKGAELKNSLIKANELIYKLSRKNKAYKGMGTTLVAALFSPNKVKIASIGDSRFYRLREGKLKQINRDQTVAAQLKKQGLASFEGKPAHAYDHILTEALGPQFGVDVQVEQLPIEENDVFLMCSDGLTGCLSDEMITNKLLTRYQTSQICVDSLIRAANQRKTPDNVTVAMVRYALHQYS